MSAAAAVLSLVAERGAGKTVCPSEVARMLGGAAWRAQMPQVHAAVDALVADGAVRLSWQGVPLSARAGPYRISAPVPPPGCPPAAAG